jgi:hypothetical protein
VQDGDCVLSAVCMISTTESSSSSLSTVGGEVVVRRWVCGSGRDVVTSVVRVFGLLTSMSSLVLSVPMVVV